MHWVDRAAGRYLSRNKMFSRGFGDLAALERMRHDPELFQAEHPIPLQRAIEQAPLLSQFRRIESRSTAGLTQREIGWHSDAVDSRFEDAVRWGRALLLTKGSELSPEAPLCIAMSASGEEGYARRVKLLAPLVREGLEVLVLENPFYGARRRPGQASARLPTVYEQFHMNHASVLEALALLRALRSWPGFQRKPLGLLGYSMGGFMVSLAAGAFGLPLAVVPVAAGRSPRSVYLDGALSWAVDFAALERERPDARELLGDFFEASAQHLRASGGVVDGARRGRSGRLRLPRRDRPASTALARSVPAALSRRPHACVRDV